jgi:hypothetical protein
MMKQIISCPNLIRDWLLKKNEPYNRIQIDNSSRPNLYFIFCIVFYCLYLIVLQPNWVLGGEMWAEMATNYFPNASASSIAIRLFSTDAGYIPLPQRIVAYVGSALSLPASAIPYFYTWSAILITGGMVGVICLKPFRALVKSDLLRFFTAIAVLLIADFESRTFINFTYFVGFFAAIVTALAFVEKSDDVPWWAWFIPILMISKPAVLSALPAMIMVAFVSKTRFRLITLAVMLFCLAQIIRMMFSHSAGAFVSTNEFNVIEKLYSSVKYFVGFLGAFLAGKAVSTEFYRPVLFGFGLLVVCIFTIFKKRTNASALILVGLSLLFFNVFLNSFALSDSWNINMERLNGAPLYRHIIVGYFGVVLVVVGLIATFLDNGLSSSRSWIRRINAGPAVFCSWFVFSGWFLFAGTINRAPGSPTIYNSQWQIMANAIDSGQATCVPIDPLGWMFQRNCFQLNPDIDGSTWGKPLDFESVKVDGGNSAISINPPSSALSKRMISLAVLIKPQAEQSILINAEAVLKMKNGDTKYLIGSRQLAAAGGLLMLTGRGATPISEIEAVTLKFSAPVDLAFVPIESRNKPVVFWMGN